MKGIRKKRAFALLLSVAMILSCFTGITAKAEDDTGHTVSIQNAENGTITFSETKEKELRLMQGDEVSVKLIPNEGYEVSKFVIIDPESEEIVSEVETTDDLFTFGMPDYDIIVSGEFVQTDGATPTNADSTEDEVKVIKPTQILVATDNEEIFRKGENIVSSYEGMYLLEYASYEEAVEAVDYYSGKADLAELNEVIAVADEAEPVASGEIEELQGDEDALTQLGEAVEDNEEYSDQTIALIDTGVNAEKLEGSVSLIGDDVSDINGHGTAMYGFIMGENKNAKVLSIKVFNDNGHAQVSDVYAAIKYAVEKDVKIINLSASSYKSSDSEIVKEAIKEAVDAGIIFVGAAGNNGRNAKYFIPGCVEEAYIIGAVDKNKHLLSVSNYGDTVDYYVVAESTSEAAAKFTGKISGKGASLADKLSDVYKDVDTSEQEPNEYEEWLKVRPERDDFTVSLNSTIHVVRLKDTSQSITDNRNRLYAFSGVRSTNSAYNEHHLSTSTIEYADSYQVAANADGSGQTVAYCIEPYAGGPSEQRLGYSTYTEGHTSGEGRFSDRNVWSAVSVARFLFGGEFADPNQVLIDGHSFNSSDGGTYGTYIIPNGSGITAVRGLMVDGHVYPMDTAEARTLSALTAHYLVQDACGDNHKVNGVTSSSNANVAAAWEHIKANIDGAHYAYDHRNDSGNTINNLTTFAFKTDERYGNYGLAPTQQFTWRVYNYKLGRWDTYTNNFGFTNDYFDASGNAKIEIAYTSHDVCNKLTTSSSSGNMTVVHSTGSYITIGSTAGNYDYFTVKPTSNNTCPYTVTFSTLNTTVTQVTNSYEAKTCDRYNFNQTATVTVKKSDMAGKTFEIQAATGTGAARSETAQLKNASAGQTASNIAAFSARIYTCSSDPDLQDCFMVNNSQPVSTSEVRKAQRLPDVKIKKVTANQGTYRAMCDGNPMYTKAGAVFNIYSNAACTTLVEGNLTTGSTGETPVVSIAPGTYYVKEMKAPKGYKKATSPKTVTVTGTETGTVVVEFADEPDSDPMQITLTKDGYSDVPLGGARFTLTYYNGNYATVSALPTTPTKQWVFETTDDGKLHFAYATSTSTTNGKFISGDSFYTDGTNRTFPLGTYTIQETTPPAGYTTNGEVSYYDHNHQKIDNMSAGTPGNKVLVQMVAVEYPASSGNYIPQFVASQANYTNAITAQYEEKPKLCKIEVDKVDFNLGVEYGTPQGGGQDLAVTFDVYNNSGHDVWVDLDKDETKDDGETFKDYTADTTANKTDSRILTGVTTSELGKWTSEKIFQQDAKYLIKETQAPVGYKDSDKETSSLVQFTIDCTGNGFADGFTFNAKAATDTNNTDANGENKKLQNTPKMGQLLVVKYDAESGSYVPQGDASFENIYFDLYLKEGQYPIYIDRDAQGNAITGGHYLPASTSSDLTDGKTNKDILITDDTIGKIKFESTTTHTKKEGTYLSPEQWLPYGTYILREYQSTAVDANDNYIIDATDSTCVTEVEFTVDEDHQVIVLGLSTDEDGIDALRPLADIKNTTNKDVKYNDTVKNKVERGGFDFTKIDEETGDNVPAAGATLAGTYQLINRSDNYVLVDVGDGQGTNPHFYDNSNGTIKPDTTGTDFIGDGNFSTDERFEPGDVILTFVTDKKTGYFKVPENFLPYGSYEIREVTAPEGYLYDSVKNPDLAIKKDEFKIRNDGEMLHFTADATTRGSDAARADRIFNFPVRGDIYFNKKVDNNTSTRSMGYIPFRITALDQDGNEGESHVVFTDRNGNFKTATAYTPHVFNTNAGDDVYAWYETYYAANGEYPDKVCVDYYQANGQFPDADVWLNGCGITFADQTATGKVFPFGTWFGNIAPTDSMRAHQTGALPYGRYKIEELPCEANKGLSMYVDYFSVEEEAETGGSIDLGTVYNYPEITMATDAYTSDGNQAKYGNAYTTRAVVDKVQINNLPNEYLNTASNKFRLYGQLMYADTGDPVLDGEGEPIYGQGAGAVTKDENGIPYYEFTYRSTTDVFDMKFDISEVEPADLEGKTVVVYEVIKLRKVDATGNEIWVEVGKEKDPAEARQQVYFPKLATNLTSDTTGEQFTKAEKGVKLTDEVTYTNLEPGVTYEIEGYLFDASEADGFAKDDEGNKISIKSIQVGTDAPSTKLEFKPTASTGTFKVHYEFDAEKAAGKKYVSMMAVKFKRSDTVVAMHADENDLAQTITFPSVGTKAAEKTSGLQMAQPDDEVVITDTVEYKGLTPAKTYKLKGYLVKKSDGKPIPLITTTTGTDTYIVEHEFTPTTADGTEVIEFKINASSLKGETVVAFEEVLYNDISVGVHMDIEDTDQSVSFPDIGTTATNAANDTHYADDTKELTIKDTVAYKGLIPNKEYRLEGFLFDKEKNDFVYDAKGAKIKAEKTFTPTTADGTEEMTFVFDASSLGGESIVVFEHLYSGTTEIVDHSNPNDENQTIHVIKIGTTAIDSTTKGHVSISGKTKFVDTVEIDGLVPGQEYVLSGILMDRETKEPLKISDKGNAVTSLVSGITGKSNEFVAETKFTATSKKQTIELTFDIDTTSLAGKTIVVFERLYFETKKIAGHEDIDDENQSIHLPKIGTKASDMLSGSQNAAYGTSIVIEDEIAFEGLIPGQRYEMEGYLVDKATGEPIEGVTLDTDVVYDFGNIKVSTTEKQINNNPTGVTQTSTTPATDTSEVSKEDIATLETLIATGKTLRSNTSLKYEDVATWVNSIKPIYDKYPTAYDANKLFLDSAFNKTEDFVKGKEVDFISNMLTVLDSTKKGINDGTFKKKKSIEVTTAKDGVNNAAVNDERTKKDSRVGAWTSDHASAKLSFVPEQPNGTVKMQFTINPMKYMGKALVAYETLTYTTDKGEKLTVAEHKDKDSEEQSVWVAEVGTEATIDGKHESPKSEKTTLVDSCHYKNLVVSQPYTIHGVLMDKKTGEPFKVDGKTVETTTTFRPDKTEGSVAVYFEFNSLQAEEVVVFEEVYAGEGPDLSKLTVIAEHKDLKDEKQSVKFNENKTDTPVQTGEKFALIIAIMAFTGAMGYVGVMFMRRRKLR